MKRDESIVKRARVCFWLVALAVLSALPAFGNIITVTNTNDSGPGSLRAAIASASAGDTINFGVTGTIILSSTLTVSTSLSISGPGASGLAISGNNLVQVFVINAPAAVTISGVTIENGAAADFGAVGGGIQNSGATLALNNCIVTGNSANSDAGGIYNAGTLTVTNSTVSNNSTLGRDAEYGGGIFNASTLIVNNSTISGNAAQFEGGGIYNHIYSTATITDSTLSANSAGFAGGGVYARDNSTLTVINSTLSGNSTYDGGAIYNGFATVTIANSTLSGNSGLQVGGISGNSWTQVKNSILGDGASGGNCGSNVQVISFGHNLSNDNTCSSFLNQIGDLNNTPAGLDPSGLQNNGGPTQTITLLSTSAAVDAIPLSYCTDTNGNPIATDQRGITRPQGSACDMGAFELMPSALYGVCLLYDPTKAVHSGASIPVKLQLCDGSGNDLSSTGITVHAVSVTLTSFSISGAVEDSGSANPDSDFRFDSTLGITGGYIFNLKTTGLSTGTYSLNFTVTGDSFVYSAPFQVK